MPKRTNEQQTAIERGKRIALRALLESFTGRARVSGELRDGAATTPIYQRELARVAELEEQIALALRTLLGPDADPSLASLQDAEREAVLDLWVRFSRAMKDAALTQQGGA